MGKLSSGNHAILIFHGFWNHSRYNCFKFHLLFTKNRYIGRVNCSQLKSATKIQNLKEDDFVGNSLTSSPIIMEVEKKVIIWKATTLLQGSHFSCPSLWEYLEWPLVGPTGCWKTHSWLWSFWNFQVAVIKGQLPIDGDVLQELLVLSKQQMIFRNPWVSAPEAPAKLPKPNNPNRKLILTTVMFWGLSWTLGV